MDEIKEKIIKEKLKWLDNNWPKYLEWQSPFWIVLTGDLAYYVVGYNAKTHKHEIVFESPDKYLAHAVKNEYNNIMPIPCDHFHTFITNSVDGYTRRFCVACSKELQP